MHPGPKHYRKAALIFLNFGLHRNTKSTHAGLIGNYILSHIQDTVTVVEISKSKLSIEETVAEFFL